MEGIQRTNRENRRSLLFNEKFDNSNLYFEENYLKQIDEMLGEDDIKLALPHSYINKLSTELEGRVKIGKEYRKKVEADELKIYQIDGCELSNVLLSVEQSEMLLMFGKELQKFHQQLERKLQDTNKRIEIQKLIAELGDEHEFNQNVVVNRIIKNHLLNR